MDTYTVYTIKYYSKQVKTSDAIYGSRDESSLEMAWYVWAVTNRDRAVVVDLGMSEEGATKMGRTLEQSIPEGLRAVGIEPEMVQDVVLTHLHLDHTGTLASFPSATFWVQSDEMAFFTGRHLSRYPYRSMVEIEDLCELLRLNYAGRVRFVDGDKELWPGISVHKVGGHSPGLQVVRVNTQRGAAVIASDAVHLHRNLEEFIPFPVLHDFAEMQDGYDRVLELASSKALIFSGHDTATLSQFELVAPGISKLG